MGDRRVDLVLGAVDTIPRAYHGDQRLTAGTDRGIFEYWGPFALPKCTHRGCSLHQMRGLSSMRENAPPPLGRR